MPENSSESGSQTKRDRIVEELQDLILSGELPRGARLRQDQLAERFHTSITPVREALRLLESQGLVTGEAHKGVRIAAVDESELTAIYVMRRLIEPYAVSRAALRMSRKDFAAAADLNERMAAAGESGDRWAVRSANREFHFLFYERCGISALPDRIRSLWLVFPWDVAMDVRDRTRESYSEHTAWLAAARDGDLEAAANASGEHIRSGYVVVMARLTGTPVVDPFPPQAD